MTDPVDKPYGCRYCDRRYWTPQGRGGHEWAEHGVPGSAPHSNNVRGRKQHRFL